MRSSLRRSVVGPLRGLAALALSHCLAASRAGGGAPAPPREEITTAACRDAEGPSDHSAPAQELYVRATCEEMAGRRLLALRLLQMALRRDPAPALARRLQAKTDALLLELASVRIEPGSLPDGATATVASKKVDLGSKRWVDPGKVEVRVSAPGYLSRTLTLELGRGEERVLTLTLDPERPAPKPAIATPALATPAPATPPSFPWRTVGWATAGVGAAGLVAGGITGWLAMGRADVVRSECPSTTTCTAQGVSAARAGSTLAKVTNVTLLAGAVLTLGGLGIVIFSKPKATLRPVVGEVNGFVVGGAL